MYFGAKYVSPKVENLAECQYNPNYEQDFYDEFYRIHWMAESEINFGLQLHSLLEGEYDLDIKRKAPWEPEEKGPTLMDRIKKMVDAVVKWIKEAFIKLAQHASDLYKKIRDNTLRDQALQKMFKNFKYEDIQKAKDKGWPGIPERLMTPAKASTNPMESDVYDTYRTYCREGKYIDIMNNIYEVGDDKLEKKLDEIVTNQTLENAKEKYEEIVAEIKEFKKHYDLNRGDYVYVQAFAPDSRVKGYRNLADEKGGKEGYYIPRAEKFAVIQDIVYNSQKQLGDLRKGFEDNFLKTYNARIKKDKGDLIATKLKKDTSDNKGSEVYAYYLKAKLAISTFRLGIAKNIMSELVQSINQTFSYAFMVFTYILSSTKSYLFGVAVKDKFAGKKEESKAKKEEEKEPEPEPQAASYVDYGAQFIIECGLMY